MTGFIVVGGLRSPTLLDFKLLALFLGALACGFLLGCALGELLRLIANCYSLAGSHNLGQICVEACGRKSGLLGGDVLCACACEGDA